jgi:Arc/MetJ-type ribon-helix-helix transcriptional regulator
MSQKKRSATLSPTVYAWIEGLVSTGEYLDIDDAVTDLLMQVKRGTHSKLTRPGNIQAITTPVLVNTTPVLTSTHAESIGSEVVKPLPPDTKTESPADAFFDMDFDA